jgi:intracellular multiplication protein IcmL
MADAMEAVALRNKFYKDNSSRVMAILMLSMLINIALVTLIYYMFMNPPQPRYFATSINGRITPLFPLNEPNQSDAAVLQWATTAGIAAFSYNFVNYRTELQAASGFFTPKGWSQFMKALQDSNNLDAIRAKKLIVSAVAKRAPIILEKGILGGKYAWRIQLPLLITYQSPSEFSQTEDVVRLTVTRVSTLNSPRGIGITQFVVEPKTGA